jgi:hypothetical protein
MISVKTRRSYMGGSGSGRWYRYFARETVDGLKSLDINWLNRKGYLVTGSLFSVHWSCNGKPIGNIDLQSRDDRLVLEYRCRIADSEWESVTETVLLDLTPCNYGGWRPWFICPGVRNGVPCQRRVGKLYSAGKYFLCRHCYDLAYQSQREPERDRQLSITQNIRMRLGGSASLAEPFPLKPKGMHWNTYEQLQHKAAEAELRQWAFVE